MKEALFPFLMILGPEPRVRFWPLWFVFFVLIAPLMWIALLGLGLFQAPYEAWYASRRWLARRRLQARVEAAFPGQTVADVAAAAPFAMGNAQGESGYHVWDKRAGPSPPYLASGLSARDAEAFIVEAMLAEYSAGGKQASGL